MKHLFFVFITAFLLQTASSAQADNNKVKPSSQIPTKPKLKFIENIEILERKVSDVAIADPEKEWVSSSLNTAKINTANLGINIESCSLLQFKYALLTDREVESLTNVLLYRFIDDWWGTRYRYGGSDKEGIDCSSFAEQLLRTVYKVNLPRIAKDQYTVCDKIEEDKLREGDLVFFNANGSISHVGVYLGSNYFVHSSTSSGVMISNLAEDYYNQRFAGGGRLLTQQ